MHLFIILIQVGCHGRPAHPHHLEDMFGEENPNWDRGGQVAEDAKGPPDGIWKRRVGVAKAGEEGWSAAAGGVCVWLLLGVLGGSGC